MQSRLKELGAQLDDKFTELVLGKPPLFVGLRGGARVRALRQHRLIEFEKAFSLYMAGKVGAEVVHYRAKKLKITGKRKRKLATGERQKPGGVRWCLAR